VLRLGELAVRPPAKGEVRIRVQAAGVAWGNLAMMRGEYPGMPRPPFVPGYEVAGVVDAVGPGVSEPAIGARVLALCWYGGWADFAVVRAADAIPVPAALDPVTAGALPLNYFTAWQMLHRKARVRAGETVLVHGAAGGVGTAVIQLALLAGARVLGTASAGKHELVRRLGAEPLDPRAAWEDAVRGAGGADVVLDSIGGAHVVRSFRVLRRGGRLITYGFREPGASTAWGLAKLVARNLAWSALPNGKRAALYSSGGSYRRHPGSAREDLRRIVELAGAGRIAPIVGATLPLAEAARAAGMLERGEVEGKIVLVA